jgi:glycosyltransferase involved in cell wall biosynthesis
MTPAELAGRTVEPRDARPFELVAPRAAGLDLSRLKVCFVAGVIGSGGAEQQLYYALKTLQQQGVGLRLLYMGDHNWSDKFRGLGIPVSCVGQSPSRAVRIARMLSELGGDRPHVIQSQNFYTNLYAVAAARALGAIEVGAVRNDVLSEIRELGRPMGWLSLRLPRVVAVNSRSAIDSARALGIPSGRLHFLPNAVDTDRYTPLRRCAANRIQILVAARLSAQKRIDRFLSALARVRARIGDHVTGVVVGHDLDRLGPSLRAQAASLGLLPHGVELRPPVADMRDVYRHADIFALTSDWEGTPNVVMEAMSAALPVVATRVGGVPDLVQHGRTGFLVDPADEDALVESLVALAGNATLRLEVGRHAREHIQLTHSLHRLGGSLADVYASALQRKPSRRLASPARTA